MLPALVPADAKITADWSTPPMRRFVQGAASHARSGVVDVARFDQFGLGGTLPFDAMWYTVDPASASPVDCHPEVELSVVVRGTAHVETGGELTEVAAGSCFLLDSSEAHVIHNQSADTLLEVFTTFWLPLDPPAGDPAAGDPAAGMSR